LALGKNTIRFRQQSSGKVRITHTWKELDGHHPPGRVVKAVETDSASLTPVLKWSAPADADSAGKPVDYKVMVSLRPDCRWPLSTTLHRNVGSDKTEWKIPQPGDSVLLEGSRPQRSRRHRRMGRRFQFQDGRRRAMK
jgi:hypothetical protein